MSRRRSLQALCSIKSNLFTNESWHSRLKTQLKGSCGSMLKISKNGQQAGIVSLSGALSVHALCCQAGPKALSYQIKMRRSVLNTISRAVPTAIIKRRILKPRSSRRQQVLSNRNRILSAMANLNSWAKWPVRPKPRIRHHLWTGRTWTVCW